MNPESVMLDLISFAAAGTASADRNNAMANFFMLEIVVWSP